MHPAVVLLISIVLAIHLTIPLGTWIMLSGQRDDKTRLWFISTTLFSVSMCAVALRPYVPEFFSYVLPWSMACAAWLVMAETFRRELLRPARGWKHLLAAMVVWLMCLIWLQQIGQIATWGA